MLIRPMIGRVGRKSAFGRRAWGLRNLLVDGNMESGTTDAWTAAAGAVLSKQAGSIRGVQCLRVAYGGTNYPRAQQAVTTAGRIYRLRGWARGDGSKAPLVLDTGGPTLFSGTSSTTWQYFDVTYTAAGGAPYFYCFTTAAGYAEFDQLWLVAA